MKERFIDEFASWDEKEMTAGPKSEERATRQRKGFS
jgi:hypothetical protein